MKTIMFIMIFAVIIIYLSNPVVSFKPFRISFNSPYLAIGVMFISIGLACFSHHNYKKGSDDTINAVKELINREKL